MRSVPGLLVSGEVVPGVVVLGGVVPVEGGVVGVVVVCAEADRAATVKSEAMMLLSLVFMLGLVCVFVCLPSW